MNLGRILLGLGVILLILGGLAFRIFSDDVGTTKHVVYALLGVGLLGTVLGIFLDRQEVSKIAKSQETKVGTYNVALIGLVIAIIVVLNLMLRMVPWKKDFTRNQLNTLSEQSVKVMKELKTDVNVTAFVNMSTDEKQKAEDLFSLYKANTGKLTIRYYDPNRNPEVARAYSIKAYNTVVLEVPNANAEDPTPARKVIVEDVSEEKMTAGFIKLSIDKQPKISFTTGHGELSISGSERDGMNGLVDTLPSSGLEAKEINLVSVGGVDEDTKVLALVSPTKQFLQPEIDAIRNYLKKGGSVVAYLEGSQNPPELTDLFKEFGIILGNNILIDPASRLMGASPAMIIVQEFSMTHPIGKDFKGGAIMGLASSVSLAEKLPEGLKGESIAKSSASAWAENNFKNPPFKKDPSDLGGPVSIGVAVEGKLEGMEKPLKIAVIGDANFASNELIRGAANSDLAANILAWAAGIENTISIRPKEPGIESFAWSNQAGELMFWFYVIILPLVIIGAGVFFWVRRRRL